MPRRKMYKKRRYRKKRGMTVAKVKQIVRGVAETKFVDDILSSGSPVIGSSQVNYISGTAQGVTDITRIGDDVSWNSISIKGSISTDQSNDNAIIARIILFRETGNSDGAAPNVTDVLQSDSVFSFRARTNDRDFQIYWDKTVVIPEYITNTENKRWVRYYKRFKTPKPQHYDGSTAVAANAGKGGWYMILMTDQVLNEQPFFNLQYRLTFKDV